MCGIIGVLNLTNPSPIDPDRLQKGNDAMFHRGPDDEGMFVQANVGMAMRRLSIIDVAHGRQPISNEDGTIHIVYNAVKGDVLVLILGSPSNLLPEAAAARLRVAPGASSMCPKPKPGLGESRSKLMRRAFRPGVTLLHSRSSSSSCGQTARQPHSQAYLPDRV